MEEKIVEMLGNVVSKIEKIENELQKLKEEFRKELKEEIKQEILNHMFVFEEEYGKKLTIAYEDLINKQDVRNTNSMQIANLEKRSELNTAYVYNHEDRINHLEKINL